MKRSHAPSLPKYAVASRAIATRQRFSGGIDVAQLPRLAPQLASQDGRLEVDLEAGRDAAGLAGVRGTIRGRLSLTCQRGLHPFGWDCAIDMALRLVGSEAEEERALQEAEAWVVQEDQLPLRDLVEDEVLLALPMPPRCDDRDCIERLK